MREDIYEFNCFLCIRFFEVSFGDTEDLSENSVGDVADVADLLRNLIKVSSKMVYLLHIIMK